MGDVPLTRANMFEPLLAADPSFQPRWAEFLADWSDDADPPLYVALGSLAQHLLGRLANNDTEGFDQIFAVIERWHTGGDAYVAEAATIGLLEALQNLAGWSGIKTVAIEI